MRIPSTATQPRSATTCCNIAKRPSPAVDFAMNPLPSHCTRHREIKADAVKPSNAKTLPSTDPKTTPAVIVHTVLGNGSWVKPIISAKYVRGPHAPVDLTHARVSSIAGMGTHNTMATRARGRSTVRTRLSSDQLLHTLHILRNPRVRRRGASKRIVHLHGKKPGNYQWKPRATNETYETKSPDTPSARNNVSRLHIVSGGGLEPPRPLIGH